MVVLAAAGRAFAVGFGQSALSYSYPANLQPLPSEVPLRGVSSAEDFAALSIEVSPSTVELAPRIDAEHGVLVFTPPRLTAYLYRTTATITVRDSRNSVAQASLSLSFWVQTEFAPQAIRYRPDTATPVVQLGSSLVFYDDGRPGSERVFCLPTSSEYDARVSDFTLSRDGRLAYLLFATTGQVATVDLASKRILSRVVLQNLGSGSYYSDYARIALGVDGQIFALDGIPWLANLGRYSLADGQRLQTVPFPSANYFGAWDEIVASPDGSMLWLQTKNMALYRSRLNADDGSAGSTELVFQPPHSAASNIDADRLLLSLDGTRLAAGRYLVSVGDSGKATVLHDFLDRSVVGGSSDLRLVSASDSNYATAGGILYDLNADAEFALPGGDRARMPFFGDTLLTRPGWGSTLLDAYRKAIFKAAFSPGDSVFVLPPDHLAWPPFPGANAASVALEEVARDGVQQEPATVLPTTRTTSSRIDLLSDLRIGSTYRCTVTPADFPRLPSADTDLPARTLTASFTVTDLAPAKTSLDLTTLRDLPDYEVELPLLALSSHTAWTVRSDQSWLVPQSLSGQGDAILRLRIDATGLALGKAPAAKLVFTTAATSVTVAVTLKVIDVSVDAIASHPADARCFGLGSGWAWSYDSATRRLLRGRPLAVARYSSAEIVFHPGDACLYASLKTTAKVDIVETPALQILAIDPDSLAVRPLLTQTTPPLTQGLKPAGPGLLYLPSAWPYNPPMELIDTRAGTISNGPEGTEDHTAFSPDGAYLYRLAYHWAWPSEKFSEIQKISLRDPAFPVVATRTLPDPYAHDGKLSSFGGTRLYVEPRPSDSYMDPYPWPEEYDLDLQPLTPIRAAYAEPANALYSGGHRAVAASVGYDLDHPDQCRVLGPATAPKAYNPASDRLVTFDNTTQTLAATSWADLPLASTPTVTATLDTAGVLLATVTPDLPQSSSVISWNQVQYRRSDEAVWHKTDWTLVTLPHMQYKATGLARDVDYLVRVRQSAGGVSSNWSESIHVISPLLAPSWDEENHPENVVQATLSVPVNFKLPILGREYTVTVDNLPPGLSFDPDIRILSGLATQPGRYLITITVTSAFGTLRHELVVAVRAANPAAPFARYSGLLGLEGGPLAGYWSATRSGDQITGIYQSLLFSRPFLFDFDPLPAGSQSTQRVAYSYVTYKGVPILLVCRWELTTDTLLIDAHTDDLQTDYAVQTQRQYTFTSHWSAKTAPYPNSARHTALIGLFGKGISGAPEGCGFATISTKSDGSVTFAGETALGEKLTFATYLSDDEGMLFFFCKGMAFLQGDIELAYFSPSVRRLYGQIFWLRPEDSKSKSYPAGFAQTFTLVGAPLAATTKTGTFAPFDNSAKRANLFLDGAALESLASPVSQALTPAPNALVAPPAGGAENPNRVAVKLDLGSGLVTGSAVVRANSTATTLRFRGMFLKDLLGDGADFVGGYYLLPDDQGMVRSGLLQITEPASAP